MTVTRRILGVAAALTILFTIQGCSHGTLLRTRAADPKGIEGTYDLFTYGCRHPEDIEHVAFLIEPDKAGMMQFYFPDKSYKVTSGLSANKALAEADAHARCGVRTVTAVRVNRILDGSGGTLGFEVLPRYSITDVGGIDPVNVSYVLKDGKIGVYIQLQPGVESKLHGGPGGGL